MVCMQDAGARGLVGLRATDQRLGGLNAGWRAQLFFKFDSLFPLQVRAAQGLESVDFFIQVLKCVSCSPLCVDCAVRNVYFVRNAIHLL